MFKDKHTREIYEKFCEFFLKRVLEVLQRKLLKCKTTKGLKNNKRGNVFKSKTKDKTMRNRKAEEYRKFTGTVIL